MDNTIAQQPALQKEFKLMTHKDAQLYFEWFMAHKDRRIDKLRAAYAAEGEGELDFSKQSLVALWRWYLRGASRDDSNRLGVLLDVGVYFAECLVRAYRTLKWSYMCSPKRLAYVNKPVVCGFVSRIGLDAENLMTTLEKEAMSGGREDSLLRAFEDWADRVYAPNECIA